MCIKIPQPTTAQVLTFPSSVIIPQILAIASRMKKDAMRLVHMPSLTVFSNWPSSRYDSASFLKASISGRSAGQLLGYGGTGSTAYAYNACTDNRVRASMHAAQLKPHTHELRPVAVIAPHTSKGPGVDIATGSCLLGCRLMHALLHWYQCLRALSDLSW